MVLTNEIPRHPYVEIDKEALLDWLDACLAESDLVCLRERVTAYQAAVEGADPTFYQSALHPDIVSARDSTVLMVRQDVLEDQLEQILEAQTPSRAHYYLERLKKSAGEARNGAVNDLNLHRWKEYDEIETDSLWIVDRRDTSGAHGAWYWGNFIPQIPRQLMARYTRAGDVVLDPFCGSGTTLIECRRLGRHGIGVELNPEVAERASEVVDKEPNPFDVMTAIAQGDSTSLDFRNLLDSYGVEAAQLVILHPPYHDIIQFGSGEGDLSNAPSIDAFVEAFGRVVERTVAVLEPERYLAVVIGDKYEGGAWIPLGFYVMQAVMDQGLTLKSIVVKNLDRTRAKREQQALWRYRALAGGFYVFKHEYLFIFQA
ncbi:MAG: DNA methyltransferase [Anaerolineae bacterium]